MLVTIEAFKALTNCVGKYPRWNTFREKVIIPSVTEINANTDIELSFDFVKRGRLAIQSVSHSQNKC